MSQPCDGAADLEKLVANSPIGRGLQQFTAMSRASGVSVENCDDPRRFRWVGIEVGGVPLRYLTFEQWRVVFGAKTACGRPGDFSMNFLTIQYGLSFAERYLKAFPDTAWLMEIKRLYEQVLKVIQKDLVARQDYEKWHRIMQEEGYCD